MVKYLVTSFVLGLFALGVWQMNEGTTAVSAHHSGNTYDCDDFTNQAAAQAHYRAHPGDQDNLDADDDGVACENLAGVPCPCDTVPVSHSGSPIYVNPYLVNPYFQTSPYGYPSPVYTGGPAPSRPAHLSLQIGSTNLACNAETLIVARLSYAYGIGAAAHLVTFQSSLGTVNTNILTDGAGYVATKFTAPAIPSTIQLTAFGDGLTQSGTINVSCAVPVAAHPAPLGIAPIAPPRTGDGGLVSSDESMSSLWLVLATALLFLSAPVATLAVAKQRR